MMLSRLPFLVLAFATTLWAFPSLPRTNNSHQVYVGLSEEQNASTNRNEHKLNCSPDNNKDFPEIFKKSQLKNGAVLLHIFAALYISGCIGYICHAYFVPALELMCSEWNIPDDVGGATFMAVGTSLPELFTTAMSIFVTEDDTGVGAVVGSAAFNVYGVFAVMSFMAPKEGIKLSWIPLLRDGFYWTVCMIVLIAVTMDNQITWVESLCISLLYIVYVIVMVLNTTILEFIENTLQRRFKCFHNEEVNDDDKESVELLCTSEHSTEKLGNERTIRQNGDEFHSLIPNGNGEPEKNGRYENSTSSYGTSEAQAKYIAEALNQKKTSPEEKQLLDEENDDGWCAALTPPRSRVMLVLWVLGLPIIAALCFTVPDCRKPGIRRKLYLVSFILASLWCAGFCYLLFWVVSVIGDVFGISDIIMGYTLLAVGTSLPDLAASGIVAKHGHVDMAVGNINGSNTFEIVICLGMVWFVRSLTRDNEPVVLDTRGFQVLASILLVIYLVSILCLGLNGWVINRKVGVIAIVVYVTFLIVATVTHHFAEKDHCEHGPL